MSGTRIIQSEPFIYHALLAPVLGSVTSTILLSQIIYLHGKMGKHFYKYRKPFAGSKPGDSWCEELGFSTRQFDVALKRIGTKLNKGVTIEKVFAVNTLPFARADEEIKDYIKRVQDEGYLQHLVAYWTTQSHQTYYAFNEPLFNLCFAIAYPRDILNWQSLNQLIKDFQDGTIGKDRETTTEITKVLVVDAGKCPYPDFLCKHDTRTCTFGGKSDCVFAVGEQFDCHAEPPANPCTIPLDFNCDPCWLLDEEQIAEYVATHPSSKTQAVVTVTWDAAMTEEQEKPTEQRGNSDSR